jgi:internalin A
VVLDGLAIARQRILREAEEKSGFLDLGALALSVLPDELFALRHLRNLNLGSGYTDTTGQRHRSDPFIGTNAVDTQIQLIAKLVELQSLWFSGTNLSDLAPLTSLRNLQLLDISQTAMSDLGPLKGLSSLQTLKCSSTQVSDLVPLKGLSSLQTLDCSSTQVRDLGPLKGLSSLQTLTCSRTPVSDLVPLKGLSSLQTLDCSRTQVSDLVPLKGLSSLQTLDCSRTQVSDLVPLKDLSSLQTLTCPETQVSDLVPLKDLSSLRTLDCSETQVSDLVPLKDLSSLQTLDCSSTQVSDLVPLKDLASLQSLNCSGTPVSDLVPLKDLSSLQKLTCSETQVSDLVPLKGLSSLQTLNCWGTPVSDLTTLKGLSSLQTLDCALTKVSDLGPLKGLSGLQRLDCAATGVSDLIPVKGLSSLQTFKCWSTRVSDLGPLKGLSSLQTLDCSRTRVSDLGPLKGLSSLQTLDCSRTQVSDLVPLKDLSSLRTLTCSETQVRDLVPLKDLSSLQKLTFSETQVSDLVPLKDLSSLQTLDCSSTQVSDLVPLKDLASLHSLNCSRCRLSPVAEGFWFKPSLNKVVLFETYIPGIPIEVLSESRFSSCLDSLRAHLRDLGTDPEPMRDVKLMVLGNGRIGKTQMCRRLRGEDFDARVESTHGILVTSAPLPAAEGQAPARLQIWDFGGQDIYHGTHALFTRSRSIFALVWIPEAEEAAEHVYGEMVFRNRPLAYWLDYVRHFATSEFSVIVVQTRCEKPEDERFPPASAEVLDAFAFRKVLHYSALSNRGRAALDEALIDAAGWLRERQGVAKIGKGRARVKRELEKVRDEDAARPVLERKYRSITQEHYIEMCKQAGDIADAGQLLAYLHNAGTVFYRQGLFGDRIILDQGWALEAIYAVFHREKCYTRIKRQHGRFTRSDLAEWIWDDAGYSVAEQALFLSMMQSCGVCFEYRRSESGKSIEAEYIAPDLLPERSAVAMLQTWDDQRPAETATLEYDLLPPGLMCRLIARVGNDAGLAADYWRDGVYFYEKETQSWALIEQETTVGWQGRIQIRTQGGQAALLLEKTTALVEEQQKRIDLTPIRSKKAMPTRPAEKDAPVDEAEAPKPLQIGQEPRPKPEYFISYAWGDITPEGRDHENAVDRICAGAEARGITVLRDKKVLGLGDRISKFMQRLGSGDRIAIVLSSKYLESPYCMYELSEIWRNCRQDDAEFLKKIRIYTLPDAKIWTIEDRVERAIYWQTRRKRLKAMIDEHGDDILGDVDAQQYRFMKRFVAQIGDMLATMADIVQPRTFDDFNKYGFD